MKEVKAHLTLEDNLRDTLHPVEKSQGGHRPTRVQRKIDRGEEDHTHLTLEINLSTRYFSGWPILANELARFGRRQKNYMIR
ncbi:hypothetical protein PGTUg99_032049 [Puccinia graminis f. sp. tritici]|uniref:Uncharacterized protein n=1 Tax=Puccinia graminis f. sp. tritici TaxID=56615 RepID=A0A5B0SKB2_PUCGR|nr:hypothetical protein PGTUg99_032049 [Puccinia graminis f. sp. tritici]